MDAKIEAWNSNDAHTHKLAHNMFSDMTEDQKKVYRGFLGDRPRTESIVKTLAVNDLPASINWLEKGAVNPVQNQGTCGSCWAFSAIGAMEGAHFIKSGELLKLSEQQCVDCVKDAMGCSGGWQDECFSYAEGDNMVTEDEYP